MLARRMRYQSSVPGPAKFPGIQPSEVLASLHSDAALLCVFTWCRGNRVIFLAVERMWLSNGSNRLLGGRPLKTGDATHACPAPACLSGSSQDPADVWARSHALVEFPGQWPRCEQHQFESDMRVIRDFITAKEEQLLMREIEPHISRMPYELCHCDDVGG